MFQRDRAVKDEAPKGLCRLVAGKSVRYNKAIMALKSTYKAYRKSISYLLQWLTAALVLGPICAAIVLGFQKIIVLATGLTQNSWMEFFFPVIAGFLLGFIIYIVSPESSGEGVPMYITSMNQRDGYIDKVTTLMKFCAATLTLAFNGTGGLAGPMIMVNGGIGSFFGRRFLRKFLVISEALSFKKDDFRIVTLCGVSAALGALLQSPLGGGIFAVEVLYKSAISYEMVFPAVLSSACGYICYSLYPWSEPSAPIVLGEVSLNLIPGIVLSGILAGIFGLLFVMMYEMVFRWFERLPVRTAWKPVIGGVICGLVGMLFLRLTGYRITGVGFDLYNAMRTGQFEAPLGLILLILLGRICMTSFTVGSGPSAGFTFPAFLVGALSGQIVLNLMAVSDPQAMHAFMAAGIAGSLAAILNVPVAACVIVMDQFGLNFGIPAVIGGIIAYQIAKPTVIYHYVEEGADE